MEVSNQPFKHCDLVTVTGRVDSATAPKLGDALEKIQNDGRFKIVLDLAGVDFMSSAGFRVLVATQRNCKRFNRGEVLLAAVPANIQSALELAGFDAILRTFPDSTSAVGSF